MHPQYFYALSATMLAVFVVWVLRSNKRPFGSFEEEIGRLKPLEMDDEHMSSSQSEELANTSRSLWAKIGGIRGFLLMEHNTRVVVRILGMATYHTLDNIDERDVEYVRNKALALRRELSGVFLESVLCIFTDVPRLHAIQAARIYFEVRLRLQALAEIAGSDALFDAFEAL